MITANIVRKRARPSPVDAAFTPWTSALLCWLGCGVAAVALFPALRGVDPWFGWLPFWLIVAPSIDLLALRHRWITQRLRAGVSGFESRRRRMRRQAQPMQRRVRRQQRRGANAQPDGAQPSA